MAASEIIANSQNFASSWVHQADALVDRLGKFSADRPLALKIIQVPNWNELQPPSTTFTTDLLGLLHGNAWPEAAGIGAVSFEHAPTFDGSSIPAAPRFDAGDTTIADFSVHAPTVEIGRAPTPLAANLPTKPVLREVAMPDAPTLVLPTPVETTASIALPPVPTIELPPAMTGLDFGFVEVVPDAPFAFHFDEQAYASVAMDALKAKLLHDLQHGGYGIEPADEAALWDRARERESEVAQQEIAALARDFASRGFLTPPGAMFGAIEGIRAKALAGSATLSRDVALKRADLLVQNRQFTVTQVREVESLLVNMHMAAMERARRAAQISAQHAVEVFNARVEKARLRLQAIQAQAQAFRDAVAAEAQKVEIYRTQLQAELSKLEIDKNKVELYRARLAGVEMLANIYRTQVQAAEAATNAERAKLETYREEINAYLALVRAKELEFSGYEAQLRGESTKVQLFAEQARAYGVQVDAKKTKAEMKALEVRAYSDAVNAAVQKFEAQVRAVAEKNGVMQRNDEAKLRAFTAKLDGVKARLAGAEAYSRTAITESTERTRSRLEASRLSVEAAKAQIGLGLESDKFRMQAADAAVSVYKEMVVGALGALNSIASISE